MTMTTGLTQSVSTTCSYCGVGCGVRVRRDGAGRLQLDGDPDHPSSHGMLCSKGRALHHVVQDTRDRLLYPQMRRSRGHPLERVDWDSALTRAAAAFKSIIARYGPEAVGFYVSGQCLTEEYYVANKLMKGFIGCNNIDTNSRLCMSSAVVGYTLALGDDLCPISYDDIEHGDCFLIAGANPAFCHPILFRRLEIHKQARPDARVIVADPRRTQSCELADLHLQLQPGTDVALFNAIARELIEREAIDKGFIDAHTAGFERLRESAMALTLSEAAAICRLRADDIRTAAAWIGEAKAFQTWWAMGLNQSSAGVDKNVALLNLSLLTGQIGKPGAGPFSLTGQPNAMGGREVGGLATTLAAHRDLANPDHRAEVARYWGVPRVSEKPGLTATEMFDALDSGRMRAIWIVNTNPAVSLPDLNRVERALLASRFVVVQEISSLSDTVAFADLVLPAAGWLEKEGTMTNSERRVGLVRKLVDAPGEALPDAEILCRFAEKMGWGASFAYASPEAIFREHAALTRGTPIDMSGITYRRLRAEGPLQWPCPSEDHPGTPRLFADGKFATADGRARLHSVSYEAPLETVTDRLPYVLTTGRLRDQWHTMTRTGKVNKLRSQEPEPFVEVHPDDAAEQGLSDGSTARIENDRGEVLARVRCTDTIKQGTVFLPMHWGKALQNGRARTNLVTNPRVDPRSRQPDFKFAAVRLAPVPRVPRRIVVIGAGAAALQFISVYGEKNRDDRITVLGNEPDGFYDRIRLPDYLALKISWPEMLRDSGAPAGGGVEVRTGVSALRIDRENKQVVDSFGIAHAYDALLLATGSHAAPAVSTPAGMQGIYTLRSRADADAIRAAAAPGARAVVLGGGLLGVEVAAALRGLGLSVTLLHRSSRLMNAQLDDTAAGILRADLADRGIDVVTQDTIARAHGTAQVRGVTTTGGLYLPCDLLVCAIGTRANDELARAAGLRCGDGVIVDDAMRASDPDIFAIGEVAEHKGQRHGTTLAAQQQADVAAAQLNGAVWTRYAGSVPVHVVKVPGLALAALGSTAAPPNSTDTYEEIVMDDRAERLYLKCLVHRNRLVGAIMAGDLSRLPQFKAWIESGIELDGERRNLLRLRAESPAAAPRGRLVCACCQVGEENLRDAIAGGCANLGTLGESTGAGTGCGSCLPELRGLLRRCEAVPV